MDIEQLRMILDTIETMGGDAQEFGIWYLICGAAPRVVASVLLFAFGIACLWMAGRVIVHIANLSNVGYRVAEALDITIYNSWTEHNSQEVLAKIKRLQKDP